VPATRAEVRGRATGAGFCEAVVARAEAADVLGWVREDADAVRAHLEGERDAVAGVLAFLAEGSSAVDERPVKAEGHEQFAVRGVAAGAFTVHEDGGVYVLVLEVGGGVRTWTLRREPSLVPAEKRMAIEAEPRPGGGAVWDGGPYEQGGRVPWPEALERGHAVFVLHGERLRGGFALQRTRGQGAGSQWLLVKRRDEHAR
jgi:acylphosphatase